MLQIYYKTVTFCPKYSCFEKMIVLPTIIYCYKFENVIQHQGDNRSVWRNVLKFLEGKFCYQVLGPSVMVGKKRYWRVRNLGLCGGSSTLFSALPFLSLECVDYLFKVVFFSNTTFWFSQNRQHFYLVL